MLGQGGTFDWEGGWEDGRPSPCKASGGGDGVVFPCRDISGVRC